MFPNAKGSELAAVLATVNPSSQAAGTAVSGWVSAADFMCILGVIDVGTFGASATVDAKFQQAQDGSGTGAKDITGKAITQLLAAGGNNRQALINVRDQDLDVNNGFCYVQLSVTVGTAATLTAASVVGMNPNFATADAFNPASVAQIV